MKEPAYKQGKYKPRNPKKYNGDCTNIVYRSSYELKMFEYCDLRENIIYWESEEKVIPYLDPITGRYKRYFPDIFMKYKDKNGEIKKVLIEVKPKKDLIEPEKNPKRKTKSWVYRVQTWIRNQAKWEAARNWCKDRGIEFKIFTEVDIFGGK
jgi:hypothetical protein